MLIEKNLLHSNIKEWKKIRSDNKNYNKVNTKNVTIQAHSLDRNESQEFPKLEERINKCIAPKFSQIDDKLSELERKLSRLSELDGKLSLILEIMQEH